MRTAINSEQAASTNITDNNNISSMLMDIIIEHFFCMSKTIMDWSQNRPAKLNQ